jgi:DNA-binding transcriptional ArsR family regulator
MNVKSVDNLPDTGEAAAIAGRLGALAHPVRIEILRHLAASECCCCKEVVGRVNLAQSTVSQHLRVLVEAGLVRFSQDRQRSRYEIDRPALETLSDDLRCLVGSCITPRVG